MGGYDNGSQITEAKQANQKECVRDWSLDLAKAIFWFLLIVGVVLFSTGGYQTFIYQNF